MKSMLLIILFICFNTELFAKDTTDIAIVVPDFTSAISGLNQNAGRFPVVVTLPDGKSAWLGPVSGVIPFKHYNDTARIIFGSNIFRVITSDTVAVRIRICDLKIGRRVRDWKSYVVHDTTIQFIPEKGIRQKVFVARRTMVFGKYKFQFYSVYNRESLWYKAFEFPATGAYKSSEQKTTVFSSNVHRQLRNQKEFITQ
jgi:hypothetical protein